MSGDKSSDFKTYFIIYHFCNDFKLFHTAW